MSTHNINFYRGIWIIIPKLSSLSNTQLICFTTELKMEQIASMIRVYDCVALSLTISGIRKWIYSHGLYIKILSYALKAEIIQATS